MTSQEESRQLHHLNNTLFVDFCSIACRKKKIQVKMGKTKQFACKDCKTIFSSSSSLSRHRLRHKEETHHTCIDCGRTYMRADSYKKHLATQKHKKKCEEFQEMKTIDQVMEENTKITTREGEEAPKEETKEEPTELDSRIQSILFQSLP